MQHPQVTLVMLFCVLCTLFLSFPFAKSQCLTYHDHMGGVGSSNLSPLLGFELDLFRELLPRQPQANFFISPYSIWNALIVAYFGSAGNTEREIQQALGLSDKLSTLKMFRELELMYKLRSFDPESNIFVIANRAYFDHSVELRSCMKAILHSEINVLDFSRSFEAAKTINDFIETTTNGKIKDLVTPQDLLNANMALVNAAYFKGAWLFPFDPAYTSTKTFTTLDGQEFAVDMMNQFESFYFGYDDYLSSEVLELPYGGQTTAMYILLPYENGDRYFNNLVSRLTPESFERIINSTWLSRVDVSLPKFSMEKLVEDELIQALAQMGIHDAFDRAFADFSGFSRTSYLALDKSLHKAFVEVNEEGTEAAAATVFISTKMGGSSVFNCNRPFLFVIRDLQTKNTLFIGAFKTPPEGTSNTYNPENQPQNWARDRNYDESGPEDDDSQAVDYFSNNVKG